MNFPSIYLASNSPRRVELLTQIRVDFSVLSVMVDECLIEGESANNYVQRVAIEKAQAGWDSLNKEQLKPVLGADTSVILGAKILGKPTDQADARFMMQQLSGQTHQVMTAVAIVTEQQTICKLNVSSVTFAKLTEQQIDWYISTEEGLDKAGGYAVQGLAAIFIENIEGSYSGIMGLPLRETSELLQQIAGNKR